MCVSEQFFFFGQQHLSNIAETFANKKSTQLNIETINNNIGTRKAHVKTKIKLFYLFNVNNRSSKQN